MSMIRTGWVLGLAVMVLAPSAQAMPGDGSGHHMDRATREQFLRKIHTGFVIELGQMLELSEADTIKLSGRLQPFDDQRIQLRMDSWDAVEQLKQISKGKVQGDAVALAKHVAQNRVQLAQVDAAELDELVKGLPAEKIAKAAVLANEYPRRIERMARDILQDHMGHHDDSPDQQDRPSFNK